MHGCHFVLAVFPNSSPTSVLRWLCHSFTVYTHKPALLSLSPLLFIGQSRINHRIVAQRCHVIGWDETPQRTCCCPWWYCIFFKFDWTQCIVFLWFRPLLHISSFPDVVLYTHRWGWGQNREEILFFVFFTVRKREWDRKRTQVHPLLFFPPIPPCPDLACYDADWWARGERRGGFSWSGISGDQSVCWPVIRSSEWVQPLLSPRPTLVSSPTHFSPDQSSRTCRQRCPPLALHCQRMMQQRHKRWPPPWTEGGGVTGAK